MKYHTHLTVLLYLFISLFDNYSQMVMPKGLKFSRFDGVHPGNAIMKFGEDWFVL